MREDLLLTLNDLPAASPKQGIISVPKLYSSKVTSPHYGVLRRYPVDPHES